MTVNSRVGLVLEDPRASQRSVRKGSKWLSYYCVQQLGVLSWRTLVLTSKRWDVISVPVSGEAVLAQDAAPCLLWAASERAAGSCCGSSQPREGTWPQLYRLDKALFTSQNPWDRVQQDSQILEIVSPPLPGTPCKTCMFQRDMGSLQNISQWSDRQMSLLCPALWKKGMEAHSVGCLRAGQGQSTPWSTWRAHSFSLQQGFPNRALYGTTYKKQLILLVTSRRPLTSRTLLNSNIYSDLPFFPPVVW